MMNILTRKRMNKFFWRMLIASAAVYSLTYAMMSYCGGYRGIQSGNLRVSYGFAIPDAFEWQPYWGEGYVFVEVGGSKTWRCDLVGICFAPLMYLDQKLVHRRIVFLRNDLSVDYSAFPSPSRLHPSTGRGNRLQNSAGETLTPPFHKKWKVQTGRLSEPSSLL